MTSLAHCSILTWSRRCVNRLKTFAEEYAWPVQRHPYHLQLESLAGPDRGEAAALGASEQWHWIWQD